MLPAHQSPDRAPPESTGWRSRWPPTTRTERRAEACRGRGCGWRTCATPRRRSSSGTRRPGLRASPDADQGCLSRTQGLRVRRGG